MTTMGSEGSEGHAAVGMAHSAIGSIADEMRRLDGDRSTPGWRSDRNGRPGSPGCASAAGRGVAVALDGVCRVSRDLVPLLVFLALLVGFATQASARTSPKPYFAKAQQSVSEGAGTHEVEVRLSKAPTADLAFRYRVGGTATPGSDFTIANSGTVTVPAGKKTAVITVTVIDDSVTERNELVFLDLGGPANFTSARPAYHILRIVDDDPHPNVYFAAPEKQNVSEGAGTHEVEVRLSKAPTTDLAVRYRVGGNATPGSDFTIANSGTVTVPAGKKTAIITVTIIDDVLRERNEAVWLILSGAAGYRNGTPGHHLLHIVDDDPTAYFTFAARKVREGSGTAVGVRLDRIPSADITLAYTVGGTATAGSDFTIAGSGTVTVPKGRWWATIWVEVKDDGLKEDSESVVLTLTPGTDYHLGSADDSRHASRHTLTIAGDDEPTVRFASFVSKSVDEGSGTHNVGVELDRAAPKDLTLSYAVGGTATPGADFTRVRF